MEFIQEELQLLYAAYMSYGDKLSGIIKSIPNEREDIIDRLSNRAKDSGILQGKLRDIWRGRLWDRDHKFMLDIIKSWL